MQHFYGILFLLLLCVVSFADSTPIANNETDRLALLDFKNRILEGNLNIMSFWNDSVHFCNWVGVTCNKTSKRVTELNLQSQKLVGSIPISLGNLTHLSVLSLGDNSFTGQIPQEFGNLVKLERLNLSFNGLTGEIPSNLSHCIKLTFLNMSGNHLVGNVPNELRTLSRLSFFGLGGNRLTGKIPAWIGNFSSMQHLSLAKNNFLGDIPLELGRLLRLQRLQLYGNSLSGVVPPAIFNISSISFLSVTQNKLQGKLPDNMGITLPNLETFAGDSNNFVGTIPSSMGNASKLTVFSLSKNGFTGTLPGNIGKLQNLVRLNFDDNMLGKRKVGDLDFLNYLTNSTNLEILCFAGNQFGGELPASIAKLSKKLITLTLGSNFLNGFVPAGIGNLTNLGLLGLENNNFNGRVHDDIGKLQNLGELYLYDNNFSGPIPSAIGNLSRLTELILANNSFHGSIPSSLGDCQQLTTLDLSGNNLNGTIPREILFLSSLSISLVLKGNSLTGSLPSEVSNLQSLGTLDVSENKLSGKIPASLGKCTSLERLIMCGNEFEGIIPQSFENLRSIEKLDLSRNNLSGQVPEFLGGLSFIKNLNLSYNGFSGSMPRGKLFSNASVISVVGNDKLCCGILELNLPICPTKKIGLLQKFPALKAFFPVFPTISAIVLLLCVIYLSVGRKKSRGRALASSSSTDNQPFISFAELSESTNGFSSSNMIGSGSFGSVYRGTFLRNEAIVAVKVLNLQHEGASKSFIDECKAMRNIRHRNLHKIITVCSSTDLQGNEFKALVFDFMSNGNFDQWLHPEGSKRLRFIQRLNIAIDVACALDYLHNFCQTPIVHCDLKPSNILLDGDMVAHVGDFGLAKFIFEESNRSSNNQTMSGLLKGSIGYIPPEYGTGGKVSILGDVYSYGILLLEMLTGKRPTDEMFGEGMNIHLFASRAFPHRVMNIIDPTLLSEVPHRRREEEADDGKMEESDVAQKPEERRGRRMEESLVSVMRIGLSCSSTSPMERPSMSVVVTKLGEIKTSYTKFKKS